MSNQPTTSILQRARSRFDALRRSFGLDRAIIFTLLARGWSGLAGVVTVILIAHFLSPAQQGYYFTFGSLVALQIIFELGFAGVILQMASHERVHLTISEAGEIVGDERHHGRLASILQKAVKWYTVGAVILFLCIFPLGASFFSLHPQKGEVVSWALPWFLVVLASSFTFQIDPVFAFLEGCGNVPGVAAIRLRQATLGSLLAWSALVLHHGLYAPAMVVIGQALAGGHGLVKYRRLLRGLLKHIPGGHAIEWGTEVWPFQWRIAVTFACGYLIFQLFNPILFAYRGPVAAGQMGLSMTVTNTIVNIGLAWVTTKAAPFGALVAKRHFAELDRLFFSTLWQSWAVTLIACATAWTAVFYLNLRHVPFAHRLLNPVQFGILLTTACLNHIVMAQSIYLRSHKQEKFLTMTVVSGLLMACSGLVLGKYFGATGMVCGYLIFNGLLGLGFGTTIFTKYRRIWHA